MRSLALLLVALATAPAAAQPVAVTVDPAAERAGDVSAWPAAVP